MTPIYCHFLRRMSGISGISGMWHIWLLLIFSECLSLVTGVIRWWRANSYPVLTTPIKCVWPAPGRKWQITWYIMIPTTLEAATTSSISQKIHKDDKSLKIWYPVGTQNYLSSDLLRNWRGMRLAGLSDQLLSELAWVVAPSVVQSNVSCARLCNYY